MSCTKNEKPLIIRLSKDEISCKEIDITSAKQDPKKNETPVFLPKGMKLH